MSRQIPSLHGHGFSGASLIKAPTSRHLLEEQNFLSGIHYQLKKTRIKPPLESICRPIFFDDSRR